MLKIGLTGGPGTGKSAVLKFIQTHGIKSVSSDKIVRDLQKPKGAISKKISKIFGSNFLKSNGELNREKLRKLIFGNPKKRRKLEKIVHPEVIKRIKEIIKKLEDKREKVALFELPLLFESKVEHLFDLKLLVFASKNMQIERLTKRDRISKQDALRMINSQIPLSEKKKMADYIINNNGNLRDLKEKTGEFLKSILETQS